jgi:drug/metabolite transporter (DMT)-like permease
VKLTSTRTPEKWTIGVIALILGTLFWSSWFILQSKISKRYPCQYSSTAIMSFFGAIQSAVICFFIDHDLSIWVLRGNIQIIAILYAVSSLSISFFYIKIYTKDLNEILFLAYSRSVYHINTLIYKLFL